MQKVKKHLRQIFMLTINSRRGEHNRPARLCDLTPCDFFLWGYLIQNVSKYHLLLENSDLHNILSHFSDVRHSIL